MKIIKKASGEQSIKIDKAEWEKIGKIAGWDDEDPFGDTEEVSPAAKALLNDMDVEVKEEKGAIPAELKRNRPKKDKSDWDADKTEKSDKKIRQKENKAKNREEEYYEKIRKMPPIA